MTDQDKKDAAMALITESIRLAKLMKAFTGHEDRKVD